MKKIILLSAIILKTVTAFAQEKSVAEAPFRHGSTTIGLSAGFGVKYNYYGSTKVSPTYGLSFDRSMIENVGPGTIGFGCFIAYKSARYDYSSGYYARWDDVIVAIRATWHLTLLKDWNNHLDPYGGIMLGARYTFYKDSYYDHLGTSPHSYNKPHFVKGIFLGAKYNFSRAFGAFTEFGSDVSNLRIGINFNVGNK